jgi:D-sedoheptulose 7-phosphate isomerase
MRPSYEKIAAALAAIELTGGTYEALIASLEFARTCGSRIFFIGNGGSAAIASHMAADWMKNGNFSAMALNDAATLTCISNDYEYEEVFAHQIGVHGRLGDWLFAISSSGASQSIRRASAVASALRMNVVVLSGFGIDNDLRRGLKSGYSFYVPSLEYGTVEITHLAILHSLLDEIMANDVAGKRDRSATLLNQLARDRGGAGGGVLNDMLPQVGDDPMLPGRAQ